jgi:phosphatidate cytidylyltransferase
MLVQRVITALILLPLLLAAVWFAPTSLLYGILSLVGLLIAWEWSGLMGLTGKPRRIAYTALCAVVLAAIWYLPERDAILPWILGAASLWWLFAISLLPGFPENLQKRRLGAVAMGLLGLLLTASTLLALAALHAMQPNGAMKLLFFLFIVFAADTGAYLAGRNFGRRKLAPNISPGKTVEGALGGLVLAAAWSLTAGVYVFAPQGAQLALLVGLTLAVAAISIVGDLTESMFKRVAGVKDSGHILPGHGGVLDRVDSILAAAPVMVLGLYLTGL